MHAWMDECQRLYVMYGRCISTHSVLLDKDEMSEDLPTPTPVRTNTHLSAMSNRTAAPAKCPTILTEAYDLPAALCNYQQSLTDLLKALIKLFMLTFSFLRIEEKPMA